MEKTSGSSSAAGRDRKGRETQEEHLEHSVTHLGRRKDSSVRRSITVALAGFQGDEVGSDAGFL